MDMPSCFKVGAGEEVDAEGRVEKDSVVRED